jgi:hypothetical protein
LGEPPTQHIPSLIRWEKVAEASGGRVSVGRRNGITTINLHWTIFDFRRVIEPDTMNFRPKNLVFLLLFGFDRTLLDRLKKIFNRK